MYMLERLQRVQSSAARLILQCRKQNNILHLLMSLHWMPIKVRIEHNSQLNVTLSSLASLLFAYLIYYYQSTHPREFTLF